MAEPISLAEAKRQTRMEYDDSADTYLETDLIPRVRAYVEHVGRISFVAGSTVESFNRWGDYLESYWRPVTAVAVSYTDVDGNPATYSTPRADLNRFPLRIYPAVNGSFPDIGVGGAITVTLTLGAVASGSKEYLIGKQAMMILLAHWFEFREAAAAGIVSGEIVLSITSLLNELRPVSAY